MALRATSPTLPPAEPPRRDAHGAAAPPGEQTPPDARTPADHPTYRSEHATRRGLGWLPALALGVALLALWQVLTATNTVPLYFLPTPVSVAGSFWGALTDGELLHYLIPTLSETLIGFALGACIALPAGYGIARSRLLARALEPYLAASQAMPAIALAPLLGLWLGYGLVPALALCAFIVFFPTVVNTALGIRTLDRDVLDAGRVDGANRWALLRYLEVPLAMPSILAGLRTSLTLSITGAIVGEFADGGEGLGELLNIARTQANTPLVFATLFVLALLAAALYSVARLAEHTFSYLEA